MNLQQICVAANGLWVEGNTHSSTVITTLSTDTRKILPGSLFIALKGENFDAHDFIGQAIDQGVVAIVVEREIQLCKLPQIIVENTTKALGAIASAMRNDFSGPLVAITGSCGKTSVKGLLREIFLQQSQSQCSDEQPVTVLATQGNLNNHIGVPLTLSALTQQHEYAVVEMGASGLGEIRYLVNLAKPTVALVNNVRPAHVSGFGSVEAIAAEKGEIYNGLTSQGKAVINLDDAYSERYLKQTEHLEQLVFTTDSALGESTQLACVYASAIKINALGQGHFTLHFKKQNSENGSEQVPVQLQVLGEHFVANALAAAACAICAGISLNIISQGLACYTGEQGRMQPVAPFISQQKATLINDAYNANPGSVKAAIDFLNNSKRHGSLAILVLGDMGELGDAEIEEHRMIGAYAAEQQLDALITVGTLSAYAADAFNNIHDTQANKVTKALKAKDLVEAADCVRPFLLKPATVLLKGSRSSSVDKLLTHLGNEVSTQNQKGHDPC